MIKGNGCCVGLELCSLWMCTCVVDEKDVESVIKSGWWHSRRKTGKERVWGKKGESCLREKTIFLHLSDCAFHTHISPFSIHHTTTLVVTSSRHHTTLCSTIFHTSCHTITPIKLIELARTHKLWYSCERPSKTKDGPMSWHWQVLMKHAKTLTSTPSINQNTPSLHLSFNPHSTRLGKMP